MKLIGNSWYLGRCTEWHPDKACGKIAYQKGGEDQHPIHTHVNGFYTVGNKAPGNDLVVGTKYWFRRAQGHNSPHPQAADTHIWEPNTHPDIYFTDAAAYKPPDKPVVGDFSAQLTQLTSNMENINKNNMFLTICEESEEPKTEEPKTEEPKAEESKAEEFNTKPEEFPKPKSVKVDKKNKKAPNWGDRESDDEETDDSYLSKPSPLSNSAEKQPPSPLTLPKGLPPPPAKAIMSYVNAASKAAPPTLTINTLGNPITSSCLTAPGLTEISKGLHDFFMACDKQQQPSIDTDFIEKADIRFITVETRIDEQDRFRKEIENEKLVCIDSRLHAIEHKMSQGTSDDKLQGVMDLMNELMCRVDKQEDDIIALKKQNTEHEEFIKALKKENRDLKMKKLAN